jgi:hypothetical protein
MQTPTPCDMDSDQLLEALSLHAAQVTAYARQVWARIEDADGDERAAALEQFLEDGGALWRALHRMVRLSVFCPGVDRLNREQLEAQDEMIRDLLACAERELAPSAG